ncbi:hypothetical protein ACJMK2_033152 [Sinanodonta woodiana]|uniref:Uncharacterized protein n=1 Tax=Sinanodonta woodiana TaxID=1069815 RepID=A0ABD3X5E4_SINWO
MAAKEDGLSAYTNGLPNEARSRYRQKINSIKDFKGLSDPYTLKCGWMLDSSIWPDLTFGDIYCYLVDNTKEKENKVTHKSIYIYSKDLDVDVKFMTDKLTTILIVAA